MIRPLPIAGAALLLVACSAPSGDTVSSMNYLMEPIDPVCARNAVVDTDGFSAVAEIADEGNAKRIEAFFNDDLPVSIIVRRNADATAEVSVFVRLDADSTPLDRREAKFAVETADEAIYRACTEDGQTYPDDGDVVIETQE